MSARSLAWLAPLLLAVPAARAQVTTRLIASGLTRPLWAGAPAGDPRVFIAEKGGAIRILAGGELLPTPFLDLGGRISAGSEQGLLGVAFHPDYARNGHVFVDYTDTNGATVVARYTVSADPNTVDPASRLIVLTQDQPFDNHNGGDLHFGPDGYLYVFLGDGGSANDPACRAQKLGSRLGKILRLDVDSATPYAVPPDNPFVGMAGAYPEIFHYGLRNPWRNSFDRLTGDLYIGDVGQDLREEIDVAPAGSAGLNFGWKMMEGTRCNQTRSCLAGTPACDDPVLVDPITELLHASGSFAITGGYVYRGCACPSEYGKYFFADYVDFHIRSLRYDVSTGLVTELTDRTAELDPGAGLRIRLIASFGEDGFGELLIVDESGAGQGEVFKMVPLAAQPAGNLVRNGAGGNRLCLAASSLPILGNVWEMRVDASAHPRARVTYLLGYSAPTSGVFMGSNEILVDLASPLRFCLGQASTGNVDVFRGSMPCEAALVGVPIHVQAAIFGGGLELCNAIEATPGYY